MSSPIPWIALCLISMFALIVAEYRKWPAVRAVAKVLASTGFVGAAVAAGALETGYGRWVLVALVLSWWGDLFLLGKSRALFLAGLVAFLAGHVAFCAAFSARGVQWVVLVCALASAGLPAAGVGRWLFPGLDRGMRGPVVAYIAVISAMVALAVGTVALLTNRSVQKNVARYVSVESHWRVTLLLPLLTDHYRETSSWADAETVFEPGPTGGGGQGYGRRGEGQGGMGLILTDPDGWVVYDTQGRHWGKQVNTSLRWSQPITLDNQVIGYLVPSTGPTEQELQSRLNRSLVWAGLLAGAVAIGLGLLLTRALGRPLQDLRAAARRIASGEFSFRVPITSRDEIGDLAEQFNDMAAVLERDEALRRQMMADIAHELRTPLSVIRGQVEALQDDIFPMTTENLQPVFDQTVLLGRLVKDLHDLALAEAGRLPMEHTPLDVAELVRRVVEGFQPRARREEIRLINSAECDLASVSGDPQRLEQVLANLLNNALRYTPGGGSVQVRAWNAAESVVIAVQDDGPGIPAEHLPHIFERFYRAEKSRNRAEGGTGLGLSIAQQIVQAHGGRMEVQSTVGVGTTFTVYLPRMHKA